MGLAVLFPGQGVQTPGMGCEWRHDPAWSVVDRAEAALGTPLAPLLLDESAEVLNRTRAAQLGVFLASLLAWEATKDRLGQPTAFAGHSLGQVTALVAAGNVTLEDGVRLVDARGRSTQQAALARPGRMVALLGGSPDQVAQACGAAEGECWLANDNAPGQLVVGGTPAGVASTARSALDHGVRRTVALNVEAAFHTPLMEDACDGFVHGEPQLTQESEYDQRGQHINQNVRAVADQDAAHRRVVLILRKHVPVRHPGRYKIRGQHQ